MTIDTLTAQNLATDFDYIERIDRLTTIAESRRNASLREIDRRRARSGKFCARSSSTSRGVVDTEYQEYSISVNREQYRVHDQLAQNPGQS